MADRKSARIEVDMIEQQSSSITVEVTNPVGIHLRPADLFAKCAARFESRVTVEKPGGEPIDGKSILDLMTLGATQGTMLTIEATGPDADLALEALRNLVKSDFEIETAK